MSNEKSEAAARNVNVNVLWLVKQLADSVGVVTSYSVLLTFITDDREQKWAIVIIVKLFFSRLLATKVWTTK